MATSAARDVAALFIQEDTDEVDALGLKPVTLRLPIAQTWWVAALAEHAGQSRNAMYSHLLRVGVSAVLAELPEEIRDSVNDDVIASQATFEGE